MFMVHHISDESLSVTETFTYTWNHLDIKQNNT